MSLASRACILTPPHFSAAVVTPTTGLPHGLKRKQQSWVITRAAVQFSALLLQAPPTYSKYQSAFLKRNMQLKRYAFSHTT